MLAYILVITKRDRFQGLQSGQENQKQGQFNGFQIEAKNYTNRGRISNRGKEIPNRGRDYKSGQDRLKTGITNRCRTSVDIYLPVGRVIENDFKITSYLDVIDNAV